MNTLFAFTFEWDPNKAVANRRKHGVGFEQAATIFKDALAMSIYDEDHSETEERWVTLGRAKNGQLLLVVHSYHETGPSEAVVSIISARPSTKHEQRQYEQGT